MTTQTEALNVALGALEYVCRHYCSNIPEPVNSAITAIKKALEQQEHEPTCKQSLQVEQEPVAHREGFWCKDLTCKKCYSADFRFKHTTPPQRKE